MTENYRGCYEYLSAQFEQVGGCEFYRELFPDNEKRERPTGTFPSRTPCISIQMRTGRRTGNSGGVLCSMMCGSRTIWSL